MFELSYENKHEAKENLEKAFRDMKLKHSSTIPGRAELRFPGVTSPTRITDKFKREIDELVRHIEREEKDCDDYLHQYCPDFYESIANSRTASWSQERNPEQEKTAEERIKKAVKNIDDYAQSRSSELAEDFLSGVKQRVGDFKTHGLGRPWGTEIRQRLATAVGLKDEVNNLFGLGFNSIANSKNITLGSRFIELLIKDNAIKKVIEEIENKIISDIKSNAYRAPYIAVQKLERRLSETSRSYSFGGERHSEDMLEQLKSTVLNPVGSFTKYSDTWKVAMNELTWSIRNASVRFEGIYHAVYNVSGFAFIWEMEFSIEDVLDLRPRSGSKVDFGGRNKQEKAYNMATSVLGTIYHDILGNTDNMKVRASWIAHGTGEGKIHQW